MLLSPPGLRVLPGARAEETRRRECTSPMTRTLVHRRGRTDSGPFVLALDHIAASAPCHHIHTYCVARRHSCCLLPASTYKIVPLLAWTMRYRKHMRKGGVPTVANLFSATWPVQLMAIAGAIAALCGPASRRVGRLIRRRGAVYLTGMLLFASQILRVALGGRFGDTT